MCIQAFKMAYKQYHRQHCSIIDANIIENFKGLTRLEVRVLVPFVRVKNDFEGKQSPPKPINFPNPSNPNFEIVILFSIVERSSNAVYWDTGYFTPHPQLCNLPIMLQNIILL